MIDIVLERLKKAQQLSDCGVIVIDPLSIFIDEDVIIADGVTLEPFVTLRRGTKIGANAHIGSHSIIENSVIDCEVSVRSSTIINSHIGKNTTVGPYAYIREGAEIGEGCRVGDYVEVKHSKLGDHTKASHLAYIGDATIGDRVNVGCGVIFANYDGSVKRSIIIGNDVFIGSNSNLIAPITIEDSVYIAAGTTITKDIGKNKFVIGRSREIIKDKKIK